MSRATNDPTTWPVMRSRGVRKNRSNTGSRYAIRLLHANRVAVDSNFVKGDHERPVTIKLDVVCTPGERKCTDREKNEMKTLTRKYHAILLGR